MSQQALLKRVVNVLDAAAIAYMATGSVVSSLQGEPRATHDIDLLVMLPTTFVDCLVKAFPPPSYYLDAQAIRDALARSDMFNLLEIESGDKVDFWLLTDDPFDRSRFSRRQSADVLGLKLMISTPEDTILQKLRWAEMLGGSERQFGDALGVFEVQHSILDMNYLEHWAAQLNLVKLWQRLKDEAEPV